MLGPEPCARLGAYSISAGHNLCMHELIKSYATRSLDVNEQRTDAHRWKAFSVLSLAYLQMPVRKKSEEVGLGVLCLLW